MTAPTRKIRDALIKSLVELRQGSGMSQTEMAKRMGVPQPRISEFESLADRRIYLDMAIDYARTLGAEVTVVTKTEIKSPDAAVVRRGRRSRHTKKS